MDKIPYKQSSRDWLKPLIMFAVSMSLILLVPWPTVKIVTFFAAVISLTLFDSISRPMGVILLAGVFALAYLVSPYWLYVATAKNNAVLQTVGTKPTTIITMIVLMLTGLLWSYLAAGNIPVQDNQGRQSSLIKRISPLAALAFLILVCNYGPLQNNISVLSDESYHITRIRLLHRLLSWFFVTAKDMALLAIGFALVVVLLAWWRRFRAETIIGIIFAGVLAIYLGIIAYYSPDIVGRLDMLRYPFISCWFGNLGPIWRINPYDERLFRIIPLISAFGVACFGWWTTRKQNAPAIAAFITALALALTPAIYYYSTTLYLELPAVALLLIALYFIEPILTEDFKSARSSPGWYALMTVGFIKETLVAMIVGIIALRLLVRTRIIIKNRSLTARTIFDEAAAALCIGIPLAVYMLLWLVFGQAGARTYSFSYNNITNAALYTAAAKALWSQFGIILPMAIAGLVLCILRRRFALAFSMIALFVIHFFFHFLENAEYVGLARFNLFLFPTLVVPVIIGLGWLAGKSRSATIAAAAGMLLINIVMSPVAITGEKDPLWSSPVNKVTTEYYFPLEDTVKWLKANYPKTPIHIGGAYGDSNITWYFDKLGYHPPSIQTTISPDVPVIEALRDTIELTRKLGIPLLVWHKMQGGPELDEQEKSILGYKAIKVFSNRNLAIVLYENQHR